MEFMRSLPSPLGEIYFVLIGLVVGSFLNVCISRIPEGLSVVTPRSRCPQCKRMIPWFENIPVFSFIFLRARCVGCSHKISFIYPFVELLTALLALLCYFKIQPWPLAALWFVAFIAPLIVLAFIDLKHMILPNVITLPGIIVGVAVHFLSYHYFPDFRLGMDRFANFSWHGIIFDSFMGALVGGGTLLALYLGYLKLRGREGLGLGDVKLAAMLGSFLGWRAIFVVFLVSSLVGSVLGLIVAFKSKESMQAKVPFGPFLVLGAFVYVFWGDTLLSYFLQLSR